MSLDNMSTATKMDPFYAPRAAVVVMVRPRRDVSERVPTIGACRTIPCIGPMHPEVMRAHSGPASSVAIGRLLNRVFISAALSASAFSAALSEIPGSQGRAA